MPFDSTEQKLDTSNSHTSENQTVDAKHQTKHRESHEAELREAWRKADYSEKAGSPAHRLEIMSKAANDLVQERAEAAAAKQKEDDAGFWEAEHDKTGASAAPSEKDTAIKPAPFASIDQKKEVAIKPAADANIQVDSKPAAAADEQQKPASPKGKEIKRAEEEDDHLSDMPSERSSKLDRAPAPAAADKMPFQQRQDTELQARAEIEHQRKLQKEKDDSARQLDWSPRSEHEGLDATKAERKAWHAEHGREIDDPHNHAHLGVATSPAEELAFHSQRVWGTKKEDSKSSEQSPRSVPTATHVPATLELHNKQQLDRDALRGDDSAIREQKRSIAPAVINTTPDSVERDLFKIHAELPDMPAKLSEAKHAVGAKLHGAKEMAMDKLEAAEHKLAHWKDEAVHKLEGAKDKAVELKDDAMHKATEIKDDAVNKATEIKQDATSKAAEIKRDAISKKDEIQADAISKKNELSRDISSKKAEISRDIDSKRAEIRSDARSLQSDVRARSESLKQDAVSTSDSIRAQAHTLSEDVKAEVKEDIAIVKNKMSQLGNSIAGKKDELQRDATAKKDELKADLRERKEDIHGKLAASPRREEIDVSNRRSGAVVEKKPASSGLMGRMSGWWSTGAPAARIEQEREVMESQSTILATGATGTLFPVNHRLSRDPDAKDMQAKLDELRTSEGRSSGSVRAQIGDKWQHLKQDIKPSSPSKKADIEEHDWVSQADKASAFDIDNAPTSPRSWAADSRSPSPRSPASPMQRSASPIQRSASPEPAQQQGGFFSHFDSTVMDACVEPW